MNKSSLIYVKINTASLAQLLIIAYNEQRTFFHFCSRAASIKGVPINV